MRAATVLSVLAAAASAVAHGPAARAQPCPPAPCAGPDACKHAADWVVVGTVLEFSEGGYDQSCHTTLPFLSERCSFTVRPPTVLLQDAVQLRGRPGRVAGGIAVLTGPPACFPGTPAIDGSLAPSTPYLSNAIAGQRYRFYGYDGQSGTPPTSRFVLAEQAGSPSSP